MDDLNKFNKAKRIKFNSLFKESLYKVQKDNLWGIFCDKEKRLIVPIEFKDIEAIDIELKYIDDYNNRVCPYKTIAYKVQKNNLWGLF